MGDLDMPILQEPTTFAGDRQTGAVGALVCASNTALHDGDTGVSLQSYGVSVFYDEVVPIGTIVACLGVRNWAGVCPVPFMPTDWKVIERLDTRKDTFAGSLSCDPDADGIADDEDGGVYIRRSETQWPVATITLKDLLRLSHRCCEDPADVFLKDRLVLQTTRYVANLLLTMLRCRPIKGVIYGDVATFGGDGPLPSAQKGSVAHRGATDVQNFGSVKFHVGEAVHVLPAFHELNDREEDLTRLLADDCLPPASKKLGDIMRDLMPRMSKLGGAKTKATGTPVPGFYAVSSWSAERIFRELDREHYHEAMKLSYLGTAQANVSGSFELSVHLDLYKLP